MNLEDDALEELLRKYRPVGPPTGLRQRIIVEPVAQRRWPLYVFRTAIAATLLISLGLIHAADTLNGANIDRIGTGPVTWTPEAQQRYLALFLHDLR
jgi:hypothetical protein